MPLDVPNGERCFLDANILYYCFVDTSPYSEICREFLRRVQDGKVTAHTNVRALHDCVHKTMLAEVSMQVGRPREKLVGWLKQHPEALAELPKTLEVSDRLLRLQLTMIPNDLSLLPSAVAICQNHQLLLGDANIVAQMQQNGITHLVTNDDDFDRVPGITIWKPRP